MTLRIAILCWVLSLVTLRIKLLIEIHRPENGQSEISTQCPVLQTKDSKKSNFHDNFNWNPLDCQRKMSHFRENGSPSPDLTSFCRSRPGSPANHHSRSSSPIGLQNSPSSGPGGLWSKSWNLPVSSRPGSPKPVNVKHKWLNMYGNSKWVLIQSLTFEVWMYWIIWVDMESIR